MATENFKPIEAAGLQVVVPAFDHLNFKWMTLRVIARQSALLEQLNRGRHLAFAYRQEGTAVYCHIDFESFDGWQRSVEGQCPTDFKLTDPHAEALRRACEAMGLGAALLHLPKINIAMQPCDHRGAALCDTLHVGSADYEADGRLAGLTIVDSYGKQRWPKLPEVHCPDAAAASTRAVRQTPANAAAGTEQDDEVLIGRIRAAATRQELMDFFTVHPGAVRSPHLQQAAAERLNDIYRASEGSAPSTTLADRMLRALHGLTTRA